MSGKTIEITTPVSGNGYAYGIGVETNVPAEIADDLIRAGYAQTPQARKSPQKATKATPKAETRAKA